MKPVSYTHLGNHLFDMDILDDSGVNPYTDVLSLDEYRKAFGYVKHPFTGVDYVESVSYTHLVAIQKTSSGSVSLRRDSFSLTELPLLPPASL